MSERKTIDAATQAYTSAAANVKGGDTVNKTANDDKESKAVKTKEVSLDSSDLFKKDK